MNHKYSFVLTWQPVGQPGDRLLQCNCSFQCVFNWHIKFPSPATRLCYKATNHSKLYSHVENIWPSTFDLQTNTIHINKSVNI